MEDISHPTLNNNSVFKIYKSKNESFCIPFWQLYILTKLIGDHFTIQKPMRNSKEKLTLKISHFQ